MYRIHCSKTYSYVLQQTGRIKPKENVIYFIIKMNIQFHISTNYRMIELMFFHGHPITFLNAETILRYINTIVLQKL